MSTADQLLGKSATVALYDGTRVPALALGTWTYDDDPDDRVNKAVSAALVAGYTHIDTAHCYRDEDRVGAALKESKLSRDKYWLTTKLFLDELDAPGVAKGVQKSLTQLGVDYIDLVLIHWPAKPDGPPLKETWQALEKEVSAKRIRYIGVSNFNRKRVEEILSFCEIQPAVNQVELHLWLQQEQYCDWLQQKNIAVMAYMPFGNLNGKSNNSNAQNTGTFLPDDSTITAIAKEAGVTAHQLCLSYLIQKNYIVAVGSRNPEHVKANLMLAKLSENVMAKVATVDKSKRFNDLQEELGLEHLWD